MTWAAAAWAGDPSLLYMTPQQCYLTEMVGNLSYVNVKNVLQTTSSRDDCISLDAKGVKDMHENSGEMTDFGSMDGGRGVLPGPRDPDVLPGARREMHPVKELDYTILRLPEGDAAGDGVWLMQGHSTKKEGWFSKARPGFSQLRKQGEDRKAALRLRDRLRRCSDGGLHSAVQTHVPDILAADGDAETLEAHEAGTSATVEAGTWVRYVLEELARVANLAEADRQALLREEEDDDPVAAVCAASSDGGLTYGIFHAAHVWADGRWSTREDLLRLGRSDLLPPEPGQDCESDELEAADSTSLFQLGARDTTWADLMEQLWGWFEAGLQVELALAMLRRRTEERRERMYLDWVQEPLHTVSVGVAPGDRSSSETTPPMFYRWSQRVEAHLYAAFLRDGQEDGEESSLMDRGRSNARRRGRGSRTPRGDRGRARSGGRRERVTEEVGHLGGGRSSGSCNQGSFPDAWANATSRHHRWREDGGREGREWRDARGSRAPKSSGAGSSRDHEPATGSGDPAPASSSGDVVPVVNEASGIPDLQVPMTRQRTFGGISSSTRRPSPTRGARYRSRGCLCRC